MLTFGRRVAGYVACTAWATMSFASAADVSAVRLKAPPRPAWDWSGAYLGGHTGYGAGTANAAILAPSSNSFGSLFVGTQLGYNVVLPSRWLLGVEADLTFANFWLDDQIAARVTPAGVEVNEQIDAIARLRARLGLTQGHWLWYGAFGLSWSQARLFEQPGVIVEADKLLRTRLGWNVGVGAELAVAPQWSTRIEYIYDSLGNISADFPSGRHYESNFDLHTVRVGVNYKLGGPLNGATRFYNAGPSVGGWEWNVHGQTTFIAQAYPSFNSPYQGENSLNGPRQAKNTTSATAFLGVKLPTGTEFYFNPEIMQGGGLSETYGLGGYSNGEAQKSGFPIPRANIARIFARHSFGLSGEQETIADGPNQIAGKQDISRITVAAGKFPVIDVFDGNAFSHDPRKDFLNWNMYCCGSYDLTMDKVGYTWGTYVELNQKSWAIRAGYFLLPTSSNVNTFDTRMPDRGEYIIEGEIRYSIFSQPGKLRLIGWLNRGVAGSYSEAVGQPLSTPDYPNIELTRRVRNNYGFLANVEQAITDQVGFFSRASWGAGQTEKLGWSDVDASFSAGTVIKGASWGRPDDRIGIGGVLDWLSPQARTYFASGGLGILIGDGQLNYKAEKIFETFYAYSVNSYFTVTLDYQFIVDPAYNADRGPVSIFSTRLHAEF